jgi:O-antigen ligase
MTALSLHSGSMVRTAATRCAMPWGMALAIAAAVVGIYHDAVEVGVDTYEFEVTTESLNTQEDSEGQVEVGTPQKKICFAALALLGGYMAFVRSPYRKFQSNAIGWLVLAGLGWAATTLLWSVEPSVTMRELVRLSVILMTAYGIARCYSANQAMFFVLVICTMSVATALLSELAGGHLTPWQGDYRLKGGMHANMVAVHAAFMVLAAIAFLKAGERKSLMWMLIVVGLTALYLTKSRTAAGVFLAAAMIQWSLGLDSKRLVGFWAGIVSLAAVALFTWAVGGNELKRAMGGAATMGRQEQVGNLTGRLPVWQAVWGDVLAQPFRGHGYEAFWTAERRIDVAAEANWYPTDAHSIYVNTLLEQGVVGLAMGLAVALMATTLLVITYRQTQVTAYALFATLIAYAFLHGITEAGCSAARIEGLSIAIGIFVAAGLRSEEALDENST